jgi:transcriptional regulator with XRE-family HTH domain
MEHAPNRIRALRHAAKISQQALADRIHVSKMTISDLERGEVALTLDYMRRIGGAFGVAPDQILNEDDHHIFLSAEEAELIQQFRAADPVLREAIVRIARPRQDDEAERRSAA